MFYMANFFEQKNRNVVPNFRSFAETIELGELSHSGKDTRKAIDYAISRDLLAWENDKSIGIAADLLSSAIVAGVTRIEPVSRAAEFLLNNRELASPSQVDLAERILEITQKHPSETQLPRISNFLEGQTRVVLQKRIKRLKDAAVRFHADPIVYTELARLYSILGHKEKAKRNMTVALGIAPENRYVLRSFVRLYVHYREVEYAYNVLRRAAVTRQDPWLLSAEIALATILERNSRLIKPGMELLRSGRFSEFSLAELSSGLGTIELLDGSRRKSRDLFRAALSNPNDNALAQVEWALSKDRLFELDVTQFNVKRNYEALALEAFNNSEWNKALEHSENWFMDMPFAKRPIMLGSHVSSVILDDQKSAEMFCRAGLVAHPGDPQLVNNLAYALALDGRADEALSLLQNLNIAEAEELSTRVCLTATKGLISFRKGNHDLGRKLYLEAIESAGKISSSHYTQLAILNYAREELMCNSEYVEAVKDKVRRLKIDPKAKSLKIFFDKVTSLLNKKVSS